MTEHSVPAILDSILEPLASILIRVNRASIIAKAYNLPGPFIQTITTAKLKLDDAWESLQEIVTALNPQYYEDEP